MKDLDVRDDFGLSKIKIEQDPRKRKALEIEALERVKRLRLSMEKEGRFK